jgi:hypothetical protein
MSRRVPGADIDPDKEMVELRATVQLPPADGSAPRPRRMRRVATASLKKEFAGPDVRHGAMDIYDRKPPSRPHISGSENTPSVAGIVPASHEVLQRESTSLRHLVSPEAIPTASPIGDRLFTSHSTAGHSMLQERTHGHHLSFTEAGSSLLQSSTDLNTRRSLPSAYEDHAQSPTFHMHHQHAQHIDAYQQHAEHSPLHVHSAPALQPGGHSSDSVTGDGLASGYYVQNAPVHYSHPEPFAAHMMAPPHPAVHHAQSEHAPSDLQAHGPMRRLSGHPMHLSHDMLVYDSHGLPERMSHHEMMPGVYYGSSTDHETQHLGMEHTHTHSHSHSHGHAHPHSDVRGSR